MEGAESKRWRWVPSIVSRTMTMGGMKILIPRRKVADERESNALLICVCVSLWCADAYRRRSGFLDSANPDITKKRATAKLPL